MKRKLVFVMVDGIGDVSIPEFGYKTPLQHANTPNFDLLAEFGLNGLMDPVEPGLACGSDTAHLSIFGYDPRIYYRGRGAFESMGAGLEMVPGDIAFKSNFATLDTENGIVLRRRADRNFEDLGPTLCAYLSETKLPSFPEYEISVRYSTEHRCGVRVRGPKLSDRITGTDPLRDEKPLVVCAPTDDSEEAALTSRIVNELTQEFTKRLATHPINKQREAEGKPMANAVLLRGCGVRIQVPTFSERYGRRPFMIAPTAIICGLGKCIGIETIAVPGATGDYHTNLNAKAKACLRLITDKELAYDFGFLHIKAVDDSGHDGNIPLRVSLYEQVDKMVGQVIEGLVRDELETGTEYYICLTGDHTTPCWYGDHSHEPVPFVICPVDRLAKKIGLDSPTAKRKQEHEDLLDSDKVTKFSEIDAARGVLGRFPGSEVMPFIQEFVFS